MAKIGDLSDGFELAALDAGSLDRESALARPLRKFVNAVLLDPFEDAAPAMEQAGFKSVTRISAAVYDQNGQAPFYRTQKAQCSSLLEPNSALLDRFPDSGRFQVAETLTVDTVTLDSAAKQSTGAFDLIKLDVQGAAGTVLQSGPETLAKAQAVVVEAEFLEMYKGQVMMPELCGTLMSHGFEIADIRLKRWHLFSETFVDQIHGQPVFADTLWMKPPASVTSDWDCRKACFLALFFGRADRAIAYARSDGIYGPAVIDILEQLPKHRVHWGDGSRADISVM